MSLIVAKAYLALAPILALAAVLTQAVADSPVLAVVLALLGVPGATVLVSRWILQAAGKTTGPDGLEHYRINPRVIVYGISALLTGLGILLAGTALPVFTGDPVAYVAAWQVWANVNGLTAQRYYELLQPLIWPEPPPA